MALLNKTEKLICEAKNSSDKALHFAYELTVIHIEANAELENLTDERNYFYYLYTKNHKGLSYNYICRNILHTSVSTLEDRRRKFISIFNYFLSIALKTLRIFEEAAATKL